ncbi:hypothetical protein LSTR_LSTR001234 [Laodelphax striatellus]|uniref:Tyrosine specific protein phosphatases domain-containing protein n=1 Tax=Laodelphax striatellus TaxID=195883 RepID=A0A482XBD0_LAOST|nr:hypothetical protein LSTR_LSTR001234 [Laodelphax striatellus]
MEEESKKEKICESTTPPVGLLPEKALTLPQKASTHPEKASTLPEKASTLQEKTSTLPEKPSNIEKVCGGTIPSVGLLPGKNSTLPQNKYPKSSQPLMGLLPLPNLPPLLPSQLLGLLSQPFQTSTLPKLRLEPMKPLIELPMGVPAALQSKLRPNLGTRKQAALQKKLKKNPGPIKPLMELKIEVPAVFQSKLRPEFGATMPPVGTGSSTGTLQPAVTQPNSKPCLEDTKQTADPVLESSSPAMTREWNRSRPPRSKGPFQRFTSPDDTQHWAGVTTRWLEYTRVGNPLRGTPFICFKTPLKSNFDNKVEPKDRFSTDDLIKTVPNLGLVIDLTATDRYNDVSNYRKRGIKYKKVICQGQVLPHVNSVKGFFNAVDEYVMTTHAAGKLIGVHCTHGVNRTGYLVCRYMIQRLGFSPATAISEFEDARAHGIERKEYTDHLKTNMGNMPFYVRNAGLTKFLKMNFGPKHTDTGIPTLSSRKDGPVEVLSPPRNEFFPTNRGPEMHREQFPPEKQNYQQWQPDAPNQFPEGDLRDRLSSNARISSSNFFNKDSSNEIGRQPPFQKSFYPRLNTGNQYPAGPDRPSTTQMGHLEGGLGPHQTLLPRPGPGLRDDPQQIFHKDDHFQQKFYESDQEMGDMGYRRNLNDDYNTGSNEQFSVNQGKFGMSDEARPGMPNRVDSLLRNRDFPNIPVDQSRAGMFNEREPMERDRVFPQFPPDQGRTGMLNQREPLLSNPPRFPVDQGRPGLLEQVGSMLRDKNVSQFSLNLGRTGLPNQAGPIQRDFSQFPADPVRPDLLTQSGPLKRDDGPGPVRKDGSLLMGYDRPIDTFGPNAMPPFSSISLNMKPAGPNWNAPINAGGLYSGPNSMARNYQENDIEIGRNRSVPQSMDSVAMDNNSQNPIYNKSIHERLGEHPSRERSNAENFFSRDYQSRSRSPDRRQSQNREFERSPSPEWRESRSRDRRRSRSTSRRRSRSSGRSEKRMRMTSQYSRDGDLFKRRGEVGDRRSRSRDRFGIKGKTHDTDSLMSMKKDKGPERGYTSSSIDYPPNMQHVEPYDKEVIGQKLEHISEMADKICKAVNVMRTFNFPQEFYDDPKNSDFIFHARKFQSLSNEIQNMLENYKATFEDQQPPSIVSKKTVKLDPSQYRKLQPPPEFIGLGEEDRPAESMEQLSRGQSDFHPTEYHPFRSKYNAPPGY